MKMDESMLGGNCVTPLQLHQSHFNIGRFVSDKLCISFPGSRLNILIEQQKCS
jgi:hypothetical protein